MGAFYLISGNEDFSVKDSANKLICELCGNVPEDNPSLEVIRGDVEGEKFSQVLSKLMESLETPSFLFPSKVVWLKHFSKFPDALEEKPPKKEKSSIDILSDYLKGGLPKDITLVIDGIGLDRRKAFYKLCEKVCESSGGKVVWHEKADPKVKGYISVLLRKIKEYVLNEGYRIEDAAASFLAETSGNDTGRLYHEMDKLINYAGDPKHEISLKDCQEICSRNTETIAWEFSGALTQRDASAALALIPGIIETVEQEKGAASSGNPELSIVSSAYSEFSKLLTIKCEAKKMNIPANAGANYFYDLAEKNRTSENKSPLQSIHPFRAFKLWESSSKYKDEEMAAVFRAILEANRAIIFGENAKFVLEQMVRKITGKNGK